MRHASSHMKSMRLILGLTKLSNLVKARSSLARALAFTKLAASQGGPIVSKRRTILTSAGFVAGVEKLY